MSKLIIVALALAFTSLGAAAEPQKLFVAAGPKSTPALIFAQQLCALINQNTKRNNIECAVKETSGAVETLQLLDADETQIGFARADWVEKAAAGTGPFRDPGPVRGSGTRRSGGPNQDLRALFSLHTEALVVLARTDANIKALPDLARKRLNIGPPGSGPRGLYDMIAPALGWTLREHEVAAELKVANQGDALCRGRVDAVFYLAPQPDAAVRSAAQACDTVFIPVSGREIETLDREQAALVRTTIPAGLYKGAPRDVATIGYAVNAVTSSKLDARLIYEVVRTAFDHVKTLQRADPAFARLDPRRMATEGLTAPTHEGALKLYRERNLIR
jgi:hypothetical protein